MEERREIDPGAETQAGGMIGDAIEAGADQETESVAVLLTGQCPVTGRILATRGTARAGGGTERRSAGAGPGPR